MSLLRDAAAMLVEQGAAVGGLEQARWDLRLLEKAGESVEAYQRALAVLRDHRIPQLEANARGAEKRAQELMRQVEHPGAALARRVIATARAARAAWRASR